MKYREVQEKLRTVGIVMCKTGGRLRINHFCGRRLESVDS